ncbi:MAG: pre-peptidase C-terminal domain-containing protein [Armatimonadia bacterium]
MKNLAKLIVLGAVCSMLFVAIVPAHATVLETGSIAAGEVDIYKVDLRAGVTYSIGAIAGNRGADLDLLVLDADANVRTADTGSSPDAAVRFTPSYSGTYYLSVVASSGSTEYLVMVAP